MVDWYPTLLTLAGAALEQPLALDGRNAWAAIAQGGRSPHDEILHNTAPRAGAIRVGDWKLIVRSPGSEPKDDVQAAEGGSRPTGDGAGTVELFNIAEDPYEQTNIADSKPEKVAELRGRYDTLARQAIPPNSAPKAAGFRSPRVWGEPD
jgi:arylsulfatase A-like enzyme